MYKVIIIDDEPIIRKGLINIINWNKFDCVICAEASDGEEGKRMIRELLPDIVFTDIRMPETDGLTMIREIKELIPDCKIIILTGFRDFDYVQEAIKLGVFDFVLKPSKIEDLTAVIGKAVKELNYLKGRARELERLKGLFVQNIPVLREKLLYDVICEINSDEADVTGRAKLLEIQIHKFILLVVEMDNEDEKKLTPYDRHLYQFGVINTFHEVFSDVCDMISIPLYDNETAFILQPAAEIEKTMEIINDKCAYFQDMVTHCFGFTVTIAVSSEGTGIMQLPEKLRECHEALEHKIYLGENTTIFRKDMDGFFRLEDYPSLVKYQSLLLEGIKTGNRQIVRSRLDDIFEYINHWGSINMEYLKTFYWSTITYINTIRMSVSQADNEKKAESINVVSMHKILDASDNITDLNGFLEDAAFSITEKINSYNNRSIKLILRKAMDYLQEHYAEQVTLNEVADNIYVSTYYISRMFKKELGRNFVDYLNGIRLEKAKELLRDPKYKTYEIAERVGIADPHYFSRLFKKYEGLTPTEYRELPPSSYHPV